MISLKPAFCSETFGSYSDVENMKKGVVSRYP